MTATNPNTMEDTVYLDIEEDGRIIVKASTSAPFSAYAIQRTIHDAQLTMTVDEDIAIHSNRPWIVQECLCNRCNGRDYFHL